MYNSLGRTELSEGRNERTLAGANGTNRIPLSWKRAESTMGTKTATKSSTKGVSSECRRKQESKRDQRRKEQHLGKAGGEAVSGMA